MIKLIDKILSKEFFLCYTMFYLTFKALPVFQNISILTYIMFAYAVLVFIYNRLIKKVDLIFPACWFSYGIILVSLISIFINGFSNLRKLIIDLIPIFVNLFLFFPTLKDDNYEKLHIEFKYINVYIFLFGFIVTSLNIISYIIQIINGTILKVGFYRMYGILGNPNIVGWSEAVFLGSTLYIFKNGSDIKLINYLKIPNLILTIFCIILSQCRSVYLAIIVFLIFYLLTTDKYNKIFVKYKFATLIVSAILILLSLLVLILFNGRFGSNREDVIRFALYNYNANNKIFGLSYGRIREVWVSNYYDFFEIADRSLPVRDIYAEANTHNILLQQLCTNGIIGFALLLIFLICIIYKIIKLLLNIKKLDKNIKNFYISICYYIILGMVVGMFDNSILQSMTIMMNFMFLFSAGILFYRGQNWGLYVN